MYVIGKDKINDKARRRVSDMSLYEQLRYFEETKSWVAYYATCFKLGLITAEECSQLKKEVLKGNIK